MPHTITTISANPEELRLIAGELKAHIHEHRHTFNQPKRVKDRQVIEQFVYDLGKMIDQWATPW